MKTVAQVLTLPQFLAWAKTKPQDEEFNYCSSNGCSIAQYLQAEGFEDVSVNGEAVTSPEHVAIPQDIGDRIDTLLCRPGIIFTFAQLVDALEGTP